MHPRAIRFPSALLLLALLLWLLPGTASAVQAHLELDVRELRVGETAALRLVITGGQADAAPELPVVPTLRFTRQRPTTEIVSINFKTSRITTYNWAVRAVDVGDAAIGPLLITVGGQQLRVSAVPLQVVEAPRGDEGPNLLVASLDPTPTALAPGAAVPFWQGQALVYRFSFSHRETLYGADWTRPEFEGFEAAPGAEASSRDYSLQRGEHQYTVHDADVPLRAVGVGRFELGPSVVKAQFPVERSQRRRTRDPFEDFFGGGLAGSMFAETRAEVLASNPLTVELRPLPAEGRPASFEGLVGSFEVQAELAEDKVRVGDSVTLTVTLRGDGVLAGVDLPAVVDSEQLRSYDDEPEIMAGLVGGRYRSRATLRRALVPTAAGTFAVPSIVLSWFDPAKASYVEWALPPMQLEVLPGEPGVAPVVTDFGGVQVANQEAVAAIGEDILPIHADAQVHDRRFRPSHPLPWLLLLLPGAALLVQLGRDLRSKGGQRSQLKRAVRARLATLPSGRTERLAALEQAFREAAGLALELPPAGVSPERLLDGLAEPLGQEAAELYRRLEAARYAGVDPGDLERAVVEQVGRLLGRAR
mgnify:CR=1 FL=1